MTPTGEFYEGAIALIDAGIPQLAFFLARQLAELSLKAFVGPGVRDRHDLGKLLKRLQESGDDLFAADTGATAVEVGDSRRPGRPGPLEGGRWLRVGRDGRSWAAFVGGVTEA
ncbi:hypothetical protein ABZW32_14980 [Streptomyces sp. NPDC004667]|uniref:hypothetical protein n=1 Tax=Streptomyces sp. NPDC004667 TaxID=3154285 RepID=UPI0033B006BF